MQKHNFLADLMSDSTSHRIYPRMGSVGKETRFTMEESRLGLFKSLFKVGFADDVVSISDKVERFRNILSRRLISTTSYIDLIDERDLLYLRLLTCFPGLKDSLRQ